MKHLYIEFICFFVMLLGASAPLPLLADNPYGIADKDFARLRDALIKSSTDNAYCVSVLDSLQKEGDAADDVRLSFAAASIRHTVEAAKGDTTCLSYMAKSIDYGKRMVERVEWEPMVSYTFFGAYADYISFCGQFGQTERSLKVMHDMREWSVKDPLGLGLAMANYTEGVLYYQRGDYTLAFGYIEQAVKELEAIEGIDNITFNLRSQGYILLSDIYTNREDYQMGLEYADRATQVYKGIPGMASKAINLLMLGRKDEFKALHDTVVNHSAFTASADAAYRKYLDLYKLVYDNQLDEAINKVPEIYGSMKQQELLVLARIARRKQDWHLAYDKTHELLQYRDSVFASIHKQDLSAMQAEYEALFETQKKERQIMRQRYIIGGTVGVIIFLVILALVVIKRNRDIAAKNRSLVANINEMLDAHQKELSMMKYVVAPVESLVSENVEKKETEEPENDAEAVSRRVQYYIYQLTSRKLFCSAEFDREALLEELHLQKNGFWKDFVEVTGQNFSNYLLNLRLEYAAEQIRRHPEYTVDAIAAESGFSGRSTFYRNFSARFGITPTLFREQNINL